MSEKSGEDFKAAVTPSTGPTCPWCKQQSLKVRHNKAQGQGRIYCDSGNCSYSDAAQGAVSSSKLSGPTGVRITSKSGLGTATERSTGVRILTTRGQ